MAVIVWLPTVSADVVNTALPLVFSTTVASFVLPSETTLPVGVPCPGAAAATVTVNVTVR